MNNLKANNNYICDRCNKEISKEERKSIYVLEPQSGTRFNSPRKKWDFCQRCYAAMERGVEKGPKLRRYK